LDKESEYITTDDYLRVLKGIKMSPAVSRNFFSGLIEATDLEGLDKFKKSGLLDESDLAFYFWHAIDTGATKSFVWLIDNYLTEELVERLLSRPRNLTIEAILTILRHFPLEKEARLNAIDTAWEKIVDMGLPEINNWLGQNPKTQEKESLPLVSAYAKTFGRAHKILRTVTADDLQGIENDLQKFVLMLKMVEKTYPPVDDYINAYDEENANVMRLLMETYEKTK